MTTIDVHHHFYPAGSDNEGRSWSVELTMDELNRNGIDTALASLPPPADATEARVNNDWAAAICRDHPKRLGLFAGVPLARTDEALGEIEHVFDVLGADGIGLPTSDGDVWLSDDRFLPVFAELDRRRAVVFIHPYATSRCRQVSLDYGGPLISAPWLEFPTNTARCVLGLLAKGVIGRCPNVRFILAHGGGTMVPLLGRIAGFDGWSTVGQGTLERVFPGGIYAALARLYVDCAQAYAPEMMLALRHLLPGTNLLFGSDYGYFPVAHSVRQLGALDLPEGVAAGISGGNAAALFPRLA